MTPEQAEAILKEAESHPVSYTHLDVYKRQLQARLTAALEDSGPFRLEEEAAYIRMRPAALQDAQAVCTQGDFRVTATVGFDGRGWELLKLEPGDTTGAHYGLCADLGSTTILMELAAVSYTHLDVYKRQILANATAPLQAAAQGTDSIPVLGTSVTEYGVALDIDNFDGLVGTNVSGKMCIRDSLWTDAGRISGPG